jgi:CheY-like chemotaxis protein
VVDIAEALSTLKNAVEQRKPFDVAMIPFGTPEAQILTSAILADPILRKTKLIAITDIDERTDEDVVRQRGYITRLHRPLLQSRLMDAIASAILPPQGPGKAQHAVVTTQSLKGLHLLVAEDNEMNQFVTQETLRRVGCTCEIVEDGAQALEAVLTRSFDAILMDCQMPGMDGLEASRRIREREAASRRGGHIPIIALTAEAIAGDRERCLASGMDGYVTKPINPDDLFAAIHSLTKDRRPTEGAASPVEARGVPIDLEALFRRCMQDEAFAKRTLEKFARRAIEDVEMLRRGIAAGDMEAAARVAHNLNAVANHVAAVPLGKIAFEIEQASAHRDADFLTEELERLADEARRCAGFVQEAIERIAEMAQSHKKSDFKR